MDSKRALVLVIASVAFTGGTHSTVLADTESTRKVHQRTWTLDAQPQVIHRHIWTTDAHPTVIHRDTWETEAEPKARPSTPGKGTNKQIALDLVVQRSWSMREFECLDSLWTRESNWNHHAENPSSGAYGIPQALPAVKMSGVGSDWRHNPTTQIRWGLKYIKGRYGKPCGAWGHFRSHNWY
ncbi:aggregation-promoting factor C-terminal-like domain-containing protein [Nonomuraea africana]|uniref:Lytic transglycosylase domain-containing protein n=1 Tax=Nonomuraea africana TaxID=46171 RepID=A0ABR9K964_9ACTN|nr:lytic transglycosylase domain-containing protein [Nonomuraea africana]MBE1558543.1 hypothetical protein [Nonomuraea africana]